MFLVQYAICSFWSWIAWTNCFCTFKNPINLFLCAAAVKIKAAGNKRAELREFFRHASKDANPWPVFSTEAVKEQASRSSGKTCLVKYNLPPATRSWMCNITCARLMLSCMGSRNFIRARMSKVFKNIVVLVVLDDARGEDRVVVSSGLFGVPSESFYLFKCFNWSTLSTNLFFAVVWLLPVGPVVIRSIGSETSVKKSIDHQFWLKTELSLEETGPQTK